MQTKELEKLADIPDFYVNDDMQAQKAAASRIKIDETNYTVFPVVDENVVYKISEPDYRWDMKPDSSRELPDYSGVFFSDLRFTDFSKKALINLLWASYEYYVLLAESRAVEITKRNGVEVNREIQTAVWNSIIPKIPSIIEEWKGFAVEKMPEIGDDVVTFSPFKPDERYSECNRERLVKMVLGSHEFMLSYTAAWSTQIIKRYGFDELFTIQWDLWSDKVLPRTREIKIKWMKVDGGDTTPVEAFMKDMQIDATSFPGKAFEMTFEMPDRNTGIVGFNKCCSVEQWEALDRPDILKKNCHTVCPASLIETAKIYHPNMKVDILAIAPRKCKDEVCCRFRLSMRDKSDPEYK